MEEEKKDTAVVPKTEMLAASERFVDKIIKEFNGNVAGELVLTEQQRQLIRGYFTEIDRSLKVAEEDRVRKNESNTDAKYNNDLPINWKTVNMVDLAIDLVYYSVMGLDMRMENMLFPIPYKNAKRGCYDITLMEGYNGIKYIAEKYALIPPKSVTVEVVYSTDTFRPIKKSYNNSVESYEFEVNNPFDRGVIQGAFAYIEYDDPSMNELVVMSMRDINKRKPRYASPEFWGGTKKKKENGKWVEVEMEGWLDEMVRKTMIREAFSAKHILRDPQKFDDAYQYIRTREARYAEIEAEADVAENANTVLIDTTPQITDGKKEEINIEEKPEEVKVPVDGEVSGIDF